MSKGQHSLAAIIVLSLTFGLIYSGSVLAGTKEAPCSWASGPFRADGSLEDWKNMPTVYFEDERLKMGVSNDSTRLFLFLRSDDVNFIRALRMSGIDIWLDRKGKKSKDLCFHFRGGPSIEEMKEHGLIDTSRTDMPMGMNDRQLPPGMRHDQRENLTVSDKKLEFEQEIPVDGSQGPAVAYGYDHGSYVYEFSIPLHAHLVDNYGLDAHAGQKIGVGIKYGGRPEHNMREGGPGPGGGGGFPGGMGGDRPGSGIGGGRSGGGMGGPPPGMTHAKETELWVKTVLADRVEVKQ